MKNVDLEYLCHIMGSLSGIPVRVFCGDEQVHYCSVVDLPCDPMLLHREAIWAITDHIGYYMTPQFYYYGILNAADHRFVIGPTRQIPANDQELRELAFLCKVSRDDTEDFCGAVKAIICMPLESLLLMLCSMNYMLNEEKLELRDLTITEAEQDTIRAKATAQRSAPTGNTIEGHNSYSQEQAILRIIRKGDTAALKAWSANAPAIRGGIIAPNQLRQMKNMFIVTATLASRAAIRGGLDVDDAFSFSDFYIQNCELLDTPEKITNLQYHMILEFTERVERLHLGSAPGKLAVAVANYVQHHMSETFSTEELAKALYLSRTHLSAKFHAETGIKLNDFILQEKTEEAKRLLRYTDRTSAAIGEYLGFSSQGHFSRVFKKYAGVSPSEYRGKYNV